MLFPKKEGSSMLEAVQATKGPSGGDSPLPQISGQQEVSVERGERFALSFEQQSLWLLDQLIPDLPIYTRPICLRLTGPLHVRALVQSLNQIIRRHQVLRTTFPPIDGLPTQLVASSLDIPLPLIDLRLELEQQRESCLLAWIHQEINKPFRLMEEPPVRAQLFRLSDQEHVLLFNIHCIVFDDWSEMLLFQELAAFYKAACEG